VKNKTFYGVYGVNKVLGVNFELHLMAKYPLLEINKWLNNKKLKGVIFHYEAVNESGGILNIINFLYKKKIKAGLGINPGTKVENFCLIWMKYWFWELTLAGVAGNLCPRF
jgi:pentose-5-phosphate-3-epimerase